MYESLMPLGVTLAVLTVIFQSAGYVVYVRKMLAGEIDENGTTWLMFCYGTALLTALEWDRDAGWYLLALPITCSIGSLVVGWLCWKRGKFSWSKTSKLERRCFYIDILLTVGYVSAWVLLASGNLTPSEKDDADLIFLIASNLSTAVAFIPLVRDAWSDGTEDWMPWGIWTVAYTLLLLLTYEQHGWTSVRWDLQVYPISCIFLHWLVSTIAQPFRVRIVRIPRLPRFARKSHLMDT